MNNVIFRKFEVTGKTKEEAMQSVSLNLMVNATTSYKAWAENHSTNVNEVNEYLKNYLKEKKYDKPGLGAYIVTQTGSVDTRKRPYKYTKVKYDSRTHTMRKGYAVRSDVDNSLIKMCNTATEAEALAKQWTSDNATSCSLYIEAILKENNALYAHCEYTPSANCKPWKLLVFGYEAGE